MALIDNENWQTIQKPKDSLFTVITDQEKQQILTLKKVEPAGLWLFCVKMNLSEYQNSCQWIFFWSIDQRIVAALFSTSFSSTHMQWPCHYQWGSEAGRLVLLSWLIHSVCRLTGGSLCLESQLFHLFEARSLETWSNVSLLLIWRHHYPLHQHPLSITTPAQIHSHTTSLKAHRGT